MGFNPIVSTGIIIGASSGGGSGANGALSNLTSPTAVNQDLLPVDSSTVTIGDNSTYAWNTIYGLSLKSNNLSIPNTFGTLDADGLYMDSTNITKKDVGNLTISTIAQSGGSASGDVSLYAGDTTSTNSGSVFINAGYAGGSAVAGDVIISGGYTETGTSGNVFIYNGTNDATSAGGDITLSTQGTPGIITFDSLVVVMPTGTSSPSTSYPNGSCYYNTSDNKIYVLNGGTWRATAALT